MCGIAGIFEFKGGRVQYDLLEKMTLQMKHRGPDAQGIWISPRGNIGLSHRRLSIIDLSPSANQPMSDEKGEIWVTFNGEIYNFKEIKEELKGKYHFRTNSDTEVIIYSFKEWGIDCLKKFRGMFAFALWDERTRSLYLVRDRIGKKPLYYTFQGGKLLFASEIKALLEDRKIRREVNPFSLYHYLSFLISPAPFTLFEGIYKLPPATFLFINENGERKLERYWDALDNLNFLKKGEEEIAQELLSLFEESVRLRMISDVPVGVFLSGGIDSSTNAILFSKYASEKVKTFSIGYAGNYSSYPNEFEYARKVSQLISSEHYERVLTEDDLINFLPQLIYYQDEPIGDPVCVPVYYVSALAKENGVTVCQVGEGSDELFWGYPGWKFLLNLQILGNLPFPRTLKKLLLKLCDFLGKNKSFYYEYLKRNVKGLPVFWGGAEAFSEKEKRYLLSEKMNRITKGLTSFEAIKPIYDRFRERADIKRNPLLWMTYLDLNYRLPELLLMRVDKMSMAVSLEARVPFLDHIFVEYAMNIPEKIKRKGGELKHILKLSVKKILPPEIVYRKKQGFGVPVYEWFESRLGELGRREIMKFAKRTDYFNWKNMEKYLQEKRGPKFWYLLNFVFWHKKWIENEGV